MRVSTRIQLANAIPKKGAEGKVKTQYKHHQFSYSEEFKSVSSRGKMTASWEEPKDEVLPDLTAHCCQERKELHPLLFPDTLFHCLPLLVRALDLHDLI